MEKKKIWRSAENKEKLLKFLGSRKPFQVFDVETTGFSAEKDRIIQISAITYKWENKLVEINRFSTYIQPPFAVNKKIEDLTGITNEILSDKPHEEEVIEDIFNIFGSNISIAAYNSAFDIRFLKALYKRHSKELTIDNDIDVLAIARDIVEPKEVPNFKLGTIASLYGADKGLEFHNAIDDVIATSRLLTAFISEYNGEDLERKELEKRDIADVKSMVFWEGFRGFSRIYVNTSHGSVYYDIRSKTWGEKDEGILNLVDMEQLQKDCFARVNAANEKEFVKRVKG